MRVAAAVNAHQHADGGKAEDQAGSAVTDEGQRQPVVGKHGGGDGYILDGGNDDQASEPERDAAVEDIVSLQGNAAASHGDEHITKHNAKRKGQTQFLTHHRKNEIDVGEGERAKFFHTIAEADPPWSAIAEGE